MSTYEHGTQDISAHHNTYAAIMRLTFWSGAIIGFATLYLSMVFAAGMDWFMSLLIVFGLSILIGLGLKRSSTWYVAMTGITIFTALVGLATGLIASMI